MGSTTTIVGRSGWTPPTWPGPGAGAPGRCASECGPLLPATGAVGPPPAVVVHVHGCPQCPEDYMWIAITVPPTLLGRLGGITQPAVRSATL